METDVKGEMYESGTPRSIYTVQKGTDIKNGKFVEYYSNGKISMQGELNNGTPVGPIDHYNEKGDLIFQCVFDNNGQIQEETIIDYSVEPPVVTVKKLLSTGQWQTTITPTSPPISRSGWSKTNKGINRYYYKDWPIYDSLWAKGIGAVTVIAVGAVVLLMRNRQSV
jgi:antitoxin component YwqK of YwqJK toxin-antitoxin module